MTLMASFLITGGTGLIASALIDELLKSHHQISVLTRDICKAKHKLPYNIDFINDLADFDRSHQLDYVINLAGEPIADKRWSAPQKLKLWQSRVDLTRKLVSWIKTLTPLPKAMISGSAVGWYGDGKSQLLTESSAAAQEYTHTLCQAWEAQAMELEETGVRVCLSRTGLVLSNKGGFLQKLKLPFQLGLGARLGNGQQYMSWIHIDDMVRALQFLIADNDKQDIKPSGIFNLTSPNPITNSEFNSSFATQLNRKCFLVMPGVVLQTLLGEMAQLLLGGQRAIPKRLTEQGFHFNYPEIDNALKDILK